MSPRWSWCRHLLVERQGGRRVESIGARSMAPRTAEHFEPSLRKGPEIVASGVCLYVLSYKDKI